MKVLVNDLNNYNEYINFLKLYFLDVQVVKYSEYKNEDIDIVLLTGGEDISPVYYGQEQGRYTRCNAKRDSLEFQIVNQFKDKFKLGICRGAQLLTVHSGGSLIQHVEGHDMSHSIELKYPISKTIEMTSSHHQMMYPYSLDKKNYILCAYSEKYMSDVYLDDYNNNININEEFLEPEIVYYKNTKSLAIQGHPEWNNFSNENKTLILEIINYFIKYDRK